MIRKLIFPKRNFELDLEIELDEFERRLEKNMLFSGEMPDRKLVHLKKYRYQRKGQAIIVWRVLSNSSILNSNSLNAELEASFKPNESGVKISGFVLFRKGALLVFLAIFLAMNLMVFYQLFSKGLFYDTMDLILPVWFIWAIVPIVLFYFNAKSVTKNLETELKREFINWTKPDRNYL